jgi:hypothetical protein
MRTRIVDGGRAPAARSRGQVAAHPWAFPTGEVLRRFDSGRQGLDPDEAARRLDALGPNQGVSGAEDSEEPVGDDLGIPDIDRDAAVVKVVRGGEQVEISACDLVAGDVLLLRAGDVVTADARLIESDTLDIDESALAACWRAARATQLLCASQGPLFSGRKSSGSSRSGARGSSLTGSRARWVSTLPRTTAPVGDATTPPEERRSMVHAGSTIIGGSGRAVVVATGSQVAAAGYPRLPRTG